MGLILSLVLVVGYFFIGWNVFLDCVDVDKRLIKLKWVIICNWFYLFLTLEYLDKIDFDVSGIDKEYRLLYSTLDYLYKECV